MVREGEIKPLTEGELDEQLDRGVAVLRDALPLDSLDEPTGRALVLAILSAVMPLNDRDSPS
jgi:hypothetical protein